MIGRDIVMLMLGDAKTKPHIAALVEKAYEYTDEEVESLVVPLGWYRNAIKEMRRRKAAEIAREAAEGYADNMGGAITLPVQTGDLVRYTGNDELTYRPERGMMIQINPGMHFFVTNEYVWLDAMCLGSVGYVKLPWQIVEANITRDQHARFVLTGSTR